MDYDIKDASLAPAGTQRIEWADRDMPVLALIRDRFEKEKPLDGKRMSACLHITAETANLARTLKAGGADLVLCASNPLSTQDDVAASLAVEYGIPVFAIRGEDRDTYYSHIEAAIAHHPSVTMDDGADLVNVLHKKYPDRAGEITASMEETTTGVIRLRAMEAAGALLFPVIAVNDATTKHLSITATAPASQQSTESSAPPMRCWRARKSLSRATAGAGEGSPCAPGEWAQSSPLPRLTPSRPSRRQWTGFW